MFSQVVKDGRSWVVRRRETRHNSAGTTPRRMFALVGPAAVIAAIAIGGCGSSSDTPADPQTVTEQVTVADPTDTQAAAPADDTAAPDAQPVPDDTSSGGGSSGSGGCPAGEVKVPDMVGEDHQYAQDTMQAAGFYALEEEDATGQGRLLLYDRNWTVVSQDPPGGSCASTDATITLSSKKDGE